MTQREYRGKDKHTGEWVHGGFFENTNDGTNWIITHGDLDEYFSASVVDPDTVGQYIGREDSESKALFDGDIVKSPHGSIGIITWHPSWCAFYFKAVLGIDEDGQLVKVMSSVPLFNEVCKYTKIGNRWDHPHLLKSE